MNFANSKPPLQVLQTYWWVLSTKTNEYPNGDFESTGKHESVKEPFSCILIKTQRFVFSLEIAN